MIPLELFATEAGNTQMSKTAIMDVPGYVS